jgi:lipid-A-disaccharide synthase-like uncharacterized protein
MTWQQLFVYVIGFLAQALFSGRILYQWIVSEKAKKVMAPPFFWLMSILGSYLLFIYGLLRDDFSIILGQLVSYYIYLWNLNIHGIWSKLYKVLKLILIVTPVIALGLMLNNLPVYISNFFKNDDIPIWLVVFGSLGQLIFALRFVYQWFYSSRKHESLLPNGFWIISLAGSFIIIIYAIIRLDAVLIIGQAFGFISYCRNIILGHNYKKNEIANQK